MTIRQNEGEKVNLCNPSDNFHQGWFSPVQVSWETAHKRGWGHRPWSRSRFSNGFNQVEQTNSTCLSNCQTYLVPCKPIHINLYYQFKTYIDMLHTKSSQILSDTFGVNIIKKFEVLITHDIFYAWNFSRETNFA